MTHEGWGTSCFKCLTGNKTTNHRETHLTSLLKKYEWQIKFWSCFMIYGVVRAFFPWLNYWLISAGSLHHQVLSPLSFFSFIQTFTLTHWVSEKPGNGAVEMFSRRTMQIRLYPLGDTVNGFNHQQNLQRAICVYVCVPMLEYQTQTCLQLVANKLENYKK